MYPVDLNQLARLYSPQVGRGGDLMYYKADYSRQRGAGLGSIFGAIAKHLIPFAKSILWPAAKKYVLPHAAVAATSLAEDVLSGRNVKEAIKDRGTSALQSMGSSTIKGIRDELLPQSQTGSGKRYMRQFVGPGERNPKRKKDTVDQVAKRQKLTDTSFIF